MDSKQYNALFSFIWNIANDVLVHAFEKGDYKKIILPFMVLRRIDVLLEPTKAAVLEKKEFCDSHNLVDYTPFLTQVTGYPFYNTSAFTMKTLKNETDPQRLKMNIIEYFNVDSIMYLLSADHLKHILVQTPKNFVSKEKQYSLRTALDIARIAKRLAR